VHAILAITIIIGFVFVSGCFDISFGKPNVDYRIDAKITKNLYFHTSADSDRQGDLGYGNGAKTRISGNNVIFRQGLEEIYLINA
jgi:hypothetical protein